MRARALGLLLPFFLALAMAGCSIDGHPRLIQPGASNMGEESAFESAWRHAAFDVKANVPLTHISGSFRLCLDRPGRVEILNVSMEYTVNGLLVDAFAVAPAEFSQPDLPVESTPLVDFGYDPSSVYVDRVCPADPSEISENDLVDLGVQFSKATDSTARGANLLVNYRSEGKTYTLRSEFELILCEGNAREPEWSSQCEFWYDIEQYKALANAN